MRSEIGGTVQAETRSAATLDLGLWTLDIFRREPDHICYINQADRFAGLIDDGKFTDFTARKQLTRGR
jgi:hypothetical protein